jgi:hypothetical protein
MANAKLQSAWTQNPVVSYKHFPDDPFRMWAVTAGGDEYPVSAAGAAEVPGVIRVAFVSPGLSLSFPSHAGSIVRRQRRSFRPSAFSDYPWRIDATGWVRYLALGVDGIEAHVYGDGHVELETV